MSEEEMTEEEMILAAINASLEDGMEKNQKLQQTANFSLGVPKSPQVSSVKTQTNSKQNAQETIHKDEDSEERIPNDGYEEQGDGEEDYYEEQGEGEEDYYEEQGEDYYEEQLEEREGMEMEENDEEEQGEKEEVMKYDAVELEQNITDEILLMRPYIVLSREDIIKQQTEVIQKTSELLNVSFSDARTLLQYMKWDTESLYIEYTDSSQSLCQKAGIDGTAPQKLMGKRGKGECLICMDYSKQITTLSCGHGYCPGCWKEYLTLQIQEKKEHITCPGINCGRVMDEFIVMKLCDNKNLIEKFNQTLIDSYVNDNPLVVWCPSPNCGNAITLQEVRPGHNESVICYCDHCFCFRCQEEAHEPAFCKQYEEWKVKNDGGDDTLNEKFISTIARKCPNCKKNIEKNGGCNHMTCQSCGFHFCWQCMGKFGKGPLGSTSGYSDHKCNKYLVEDSKVLSDKEDWERFRWYAERYNNHGRSLKFEKDLRKGADNMRQQLNQICSLSWTESKYYVDALNQLIYSRAVMRGSYIFGYFRPTQCPEIHKELFEHRQNELERHTEQLSRLLEDTEVLKINEMRSIFINTTKLVNSSARALLDVAVNAIVDVPKNPLQASSERIRQQTKKYSSKTPPAPIVENDWEDRELEEAIFASRRDFDDQEFERALELSKMDMVHVGHNEELKELKSSTGSQSTKSQQLKKSANLEKSKPIAEKTEQSKISEKPKQSKIPEKIVQSKKSENLEKSKPISEKTEQSSKKPLSKLMSEKSEPSKKPEKSSSPTQKRPPPKPTQPVSEKNISLKNQSISSLILKTSQYNQNEKKPPTKPPTKVIARSTNTKSSIKTNPNLPPPKRSKTNKTSQGSKKPDT